MSEIEKKWYVLRAISGKEAKVKEYLEADIKNSDLGDYVSQVLIPTEKVYQVRNGKKIVKERSYLPGYVLVEAALVGEVAHHLRNTPNVIGFLGGSEKPVPLRQSEVNRILGTVDELQESGEDLSIPYVVGETVKVNYGPFSGFSGIIEEVNTEKKKLKVMVKIFGHANFFCIVLYDFIHFTGSDLMILQTKSDVITDGCPNELIVWVLEDDANLTSNTFNRLEAQLFSIDKDRPFFFFKQTDDELGDGTLATSIVTNECCITSFFDDKRDVFDDILCLVV